MDLEKKRKETKLERTLRLKREQLEIEKASGLYKPVVPKLCEEIISAEEKILRKNVERRRSQDARVVERLILEEEINFLDEQNLNKKINNVFREAERAKNIHGVILTDHAKQRCVERDIAVRDIVMTSSNITVIDYEAEKNAMTSNRVIITTFASKSTVYEVDDEKSEQSRN